MKIVLLVAAITASASLASADELLFPSALTFEPGFAIGPNAGFPFFGEAEIGVPLTLVGKVAAVAEPFDDLIPPGVHELTYVYSGSTCVRTGIAEDLVCVGSYFGDFENGTFALYLDVTPDADFSDIATFGDGDLVLIGQPCNTMVANFDPTGCPQRPEAPDVVAGFTFIGGSWFGRVSNNGIGFSGFSQGELDDNIPAELKALGYSLRVDGIVDIYAPLAVTPMTWGAVKALYR